MTDDPFLSDDIYTLLSKFPSDALEQIVCIYKKNASWSPFPADRAYRVHDLPSGADFTPYANEIARELIWWGSNDFHRQFGFLPNYGEIVRGVAKNAGNEEKNRADTLPVWRVEQEILKNVLTDWEKLLPTKREEKRKAELTAARATPSAVEAAALVVTPIAIVAEILWTAYDLAGPGYRVLGPVVLTVALTRQKLRESRAGAAFED